MASITNKQGVVNPICGIYEKSVTFLARRREKSAKTQKKCGLRASRLLFFHGRGNAVTEGSFVT